MTNAYWEQTNTPLLPCHPDRQTINNQPRLRHVYEWLADARVTNQGMWSAFQGGRCLAACLFVSDYKCIYIYIYTHNYIYAYTLYVHTYVYTCICVYLSRSLSLSIYICMYIYTHIYTYACMYVCMDVCMCVCMC